MSLASTAILDFLPGEEILSRLLQQTLKIRVGEKSVRNGRLVHFKRVHYVYQLTFVNVKGNRETLELPLPFAVEQHRDEHLIYFDYRDDTLVSGDSDLLLKLKKIRSTNATGFHNKIVEIEYN